MRGHGMGGFELIFGIVPVVVIVILVIATSVRILRDYERAVIFRFGRRANAVFWGWPGPSCVRPNTFPSPRVRRRW